MNWQRIAVLIQEATGKSFSIRSSQILGGGDINTAYRIDGDAGLSYFIKLNRAGLLPMFAAEYDGLREMAATATVRVPTPIVYGSVDKQSFLVLEHIGFEVSSTESQRLLGKQLAEMHQQRQPYFGWHQDNTIGSTPQINTQSHDWPTFWRNQSLDFQLQLAKANGYGGRLQQKGERLCHELDAFFASYIPQPSLLHGDLWSGNSSTDNDGNPVIFDPACYYGDREADLAMTELFGGYSQDFYAAYQDQWPLDQDYRTRKTLYNLYHILNHLNLFGGAYLHQAEHLLDRLLSEL